MLRWLSRIVLKWRDRHDPAWAREFKGTRQVFTGYDARKAADGFKRSQAQSETGKALYRPRKTVRKANVVPLRKAKP